jgi:hypothetical protein
MPIVWIIVELMILIVVSAVPVVMIVVISLVVVAMSVHNVYVVVVAVVADDASGKAHCCQDAEPAIQRHRSKQFRFHDFVPF